MPPTAVTDQSFLLWFAISAVIAATTAQVWRILALNRSDADHSWTRASPPRLDPIEAAYVAGGQRLAFTVGKAALSSAGLLDDHDRAARGPGGLDGLGSVPRALQALSTSATLLTWQRCHGDADLQDALGALARDLRTRGLLLTPQRRRLLGLASSPLLAVDCAGLWRIAETSAAGRLDWTLVVAVGFVSMICAGILGTVPHGTRLGLDLTRATELRRPESLTSDSYRECGDTQPV